MKSYRVGHSGLPRVVRDACQVLACIAWTRILPNASLHLPPDAANKAAIQPHNFHDGQAEAAKCKRLLGDDASL